MIEATIICDVRLGNELEKKLCHSHGQHRGPPPPSATAATMTDANYKLERVAKRAGWTKKRNPGRNPSVVWTCPVCQTVAR